MVEILCAFILELFYFCIVKPLSWLARGTSRSPWWPIFITAIIATTAGFLIINKVS